MKNTALALLALAAALLAAGRAAAADTTVCTNCADTGVIKIKCPLCRTSRFMWKCPDTSFQNGTHASLLEKGAFCGYGTEYTPLHPNCKNSRTRINCPMCLSKSKSSSTGIAEIPCPNCDGKGNLYYDLIAVTDPGLLVQSDIDVTVPNLERGRPPDRPHVLHRRFSTEEVNDFKTVYPEAQFFRTPDAFRAFVRQTLLAKLAAGYTTATVTRGGKPLDFGGAPAAPPPAAPAAAPADADAAE